MNIEKELKRLFKDENKAVAEYGNLIMTLREYGFSAKVTKPIMAIAADERSHRTILKKVYAQIIREAKPMIRRRRK